MNFQVGKNFFDQTTNGKKPNNKKKGIDLSITGDELQYQIVLDCEGIQSEERKKWIQKLLPDTSSTVIEKIENHYNKSLALLLYRLCNVMLLYSTSYNNGDLKILSYIYANKDLLSNFKRKRKRS
jgi:hypothetical protein